MNVENEKCVMIIDEALPIGVAANTAAILGITIGSIKPEAVGKSVQDANLNNHEGIIQIPVPILKANENDLKKLREKLFEEKYSDLMVADFTDLAQGCRTYDEFISKIENQASEGLNYIGIAIYGNKKKVSKLTGNLPLMK